MLVPNLITVKHPQGSIHLPEMDLWLDPHRGEKAAFISHAHSDHVARHELTICSDLTQRLMGARYGSSKGQMLALEFGRPHLWRDHVLRLLPAGHILGSAMLHITRQSDGATLLYTGDYKLRQGLTAQRAELMQADTLIMETTFGLPQFAFPPVSAVVASMLKFVRETLDERGIPVLLGYSLGKAQEILAALREVGAPIMLHSSIMKLMEVCAAEVADLPPYQAFDPANAAGHVLIMPPMGTKSLAIRKLKVARTAMLSGWAMQSGAKFRYQVDEVFPLSDHADYPELLQTVELVKPRRVFTVHGYTREFAADLRRRGFDAWALGMTDQLELAIGAPVPAAASLPSAQVQASPISGFGRWAEACARTSEESSRLKKVALLAGYLCDLSSDEEVSLATRYFSAQLGEALNVGWAIVRRALQDASGLRDDEYSAISRSQNDSGRTAWLVLQRATLKPKADFDLLALNAFFDELRAARGPAPKTQILRDRLITLTAEEGSWLVRLMSGDLRMGSKEGLVEEAIAAAFQEPAEAVREAAMLCGDIGAAAVLARNHQLDKAEPVPFVPVKVMLASPEESAEDIWQRMQSAQVWLEDKYDGIRAQVHCQGGRVEIFTRDLKPVGAQFPEVTSAAAELNADVILDGEIIAHSGTEKLTFFDLQKRLGRRDQQDLFLPSAITVQYVVFDLLWASGESLLPLPLTQRRTRLERLRLPEGLRLIARYEAASSDEIEASFLAARRRGNEGLIIKSPSSTYTPGRRGKAWLKLKKAFATLDVVVVKAEQGHGKRSQWLSDYTFAVRDESNSQLLVIGKAYSGLTDAEIEALTTHFTENTLSQKGRVRTVVPDTVLEIAFDSIQPSSRHDSGLALRFPRIKAIRHDKRPEDIDTLAHARRLAGVLTS